MKTLALQLASFRLGRIALHLTAILAGGKLAWHVAGIVREF